MNPQLQAILEQSPKHATTHRSNKQPARQQAMKDNQQKQLALSSIAKKKSKSKVNVPYLNHTKNNSNHSYSISQHSPKHNKNRHSSASFDPNAKTGVELLTGIRSQKDDILKKVDNLTKAFDEDNNSSAEPQTQSPSGTASRGSTVQLRDNIANAINMAMSSQKISVLQKDSLNSILDWFDELRNTDGKYNPEADTDIIFNDSASNLIADTETSKEFLKDNTNVVSSA